ncbi:tyrosine-type recombinase/integrase [Bacteroidota bacterium]
MNELRKRLLHEMQFRNYSQRTIHSYISCLSGLGKYFNKSPDKITVEQVKQYLHHRVTVEKVSVSIVNIIISAYKLLHRDVLKNETKEIDIKRPRREKKLPVILSRDEINKIIEVTPNIKHKSILMIIYSGGLRISESINLKITDIDSKRMQICVRMSKGHKDRHTLLSRKALELLRIYYKQFKPCTWLFEGFGHKQYSVTSIQKIFQRAIIKAGITKQATVHTLRHSFATHLLEQGVSIQIIQILLGHSCLKTTCVYLHVQQYSIDKVVSPADYVDNVLL